MGQFTEDLSFFLKKKPLALVALVAAFHKNHIFLEEMVKHEVSPGLWGHKPGTFSRPTTSWSRHGSTFAEAPSTSLREMLKSDQIPARKAIG